jgi:hypothetical protein
MSNQNIRDRFYGINDPVADKMFKRINDITKEEKIKTGFVGASILWAFYEAIFYLMDVCFVHLKATRNHPRPLQPTERRKTPNLTRSYRDYLQVN